MKKKRNTRFQSKDFLVISVCCAGIFTALYAYYTDVNMTLLRQDKKTIAHITYKYKSVQRRFQDRVFWDRVRQMSPLYDGDVIRTAPASEATIIFDSGSELKVGALTLIQIFSDENGEQLLFSEGNIFVKSAGETRVTSGKNTVTLAGGTSAGAAVKPGIPAKNTGTQADMTVNTQTAGSAQGVLNVTLLEGSAIVENDHGTAEIAPGEAYSSAAGSESENGAIFALIEPAPFLRVTASETGDATVPFAWHIVHSAGTERVSIEFFRDKNASLPVFTLEPADSASRSARANLPEGFFYWKIFVRQDGSQFARKEEASGSISVQRPEKPEETPPLPARIMESQNETVITAGTPAEVLIPAQFIETLALLAKIPPAESDSARENSDSLTAGMGYIKTETAATQAEITQEAAQTPVQTLHTPNRQPVQTAKAPVPAAKAPAAAAAKRPPVQTAKSPVPPPKKAEPVPQILSVPPFPAPKPLTPKNGTVFGTGQLAAGEILFSWTTVEAAGEYVFGIYNDRDEKVFETRVPATSLALKDLRVLDRGSFTWRVEGRPKKQTERKPPEILAAVSGFIVDIPQIQTSVSAPEAAVYTEIPGKMTFIGQEETRYTNTENIKYAQESAPIYVREQKQVYAQEQPSVYAEESELRFLPAETLKYQEEPKSKYTDEPKMEMTGKETEYVR